MAAWTKVLIGALVVVALAMFGVLVGGNSRRGAAAIGDNADASPSVEKPATVNDGGVGDKANGQQEITIDLGPVVAAIKDGNDKLSAKLDQMAQAAQQPKPIDPATSATGDTSSAPAPSTEPAAEPCPPEKPPVTLETLDQRVTSLEAWRPTVDDRLRRHSRQIKIINEKLVVIIKGAKPAEMPGLVKTPYTVKSEIVVHNGPRPTPAPPRVTRP